MKKKKWRDVKNALVMVVVMAAMMSTATYAWFTLTNDATVTGMQMTAGGSSGLQVSNDRAEWSDSIDLNALLPDDADPNKTIHQVTVKEGEGAVFYQPNYQNETTVNGVTVISPANETSFVAKYEYYLRSVDGEVNVGIKTAQGLNGTDGSYVRATDGDNANSAAAAVRVGIVVEGSTEMHIFEPNNDLHIVSDEDDKAVNSIADFTPATADVTANQAGAITGGSDTYTSNGLFTTVSGQGKKITMYVWLEGTDEDCVNQIQADEIAGQMTFTIIQ